MTIAPFRLIRPKSVEALLEAQRRIAEAPERRSLRAGGVDIIDHLKEGLSSPEELVDLRHVEDAGWNDVSGTPAGLTVGAFVTLADLAASEALAGDSFAALREAAGSAATPSIRNAATVAGNLLQRPRCWYYRDADLVCLKKGGSVCLAVSGDNRYHAIYGGGPSYIVHPSTLATPLVALDAELDVRAADGTDRAMAIETLFALPSVDVKTEHTLAPGDLILRVRIPGAAGARSAYYAAREKRSFDWPLSEAAVSVRIAKGTFESVRVVLGHVAPIPWRSAPAEAALTGQPVNAETIAAAAEAAVVDARPMAGNRYKIPLTRGVLRHALHAASGVPLPA